MNRFIFLRVKARVGQEVERALLGRKMRGGLLPRGSLKSKMKRMRKDIM